MGANSWVKRGKRDMFAVGCVVEKGRVVVVIVGLVMVVVLALRWRGARLSVVRKACIDDLITVVLMRMI